MILISFINFFKVSSNLGKLLQNCKKRRRKNAISLSKVNKKLWIINKILKDWGYLSKFDKLIIAKIFIKIYLSTIPYD